MSFIARPEDRGSPLAWRLGVLLLVGASAPLELGLAPPLLLLLLFAALSVRHEAWIARWLHEDPRGLAGLPTGLRAAIVGAIVLLGAVVGAVAALGVGGLLVAFPAAIPGLAVIGAAAAALPRLRGRGRAFGLVVAVLSLPAAAALGARIEASGTQARGFATSGPIFGVHPFQATAVVIDGYGPFDLPINDYVEPSGWRGYGPEALAAALEMALHRIAELHFSEDGPARAREAFAGARVAVFTSPGIRERRSGAAASEAELRLRIDSGTTGQGSRVEIVCPGTRSDPRGLQPDGVMERMCPDRFAGEGSAGLGLTGRWTGYAEGRGNERMSAARLLGWTRSDDLAGARIVRGELRGYALSVLCLLGALGLFGLRRPGASASLEAIQGLASGVLGAAGILVVVVAVFVARHVALDVFAAPPPGFDVWSISSWGGILALVGIGWLWRSPALLRSRPSESPHVAALVTAAVVIVTAADLRLTSWIRPDLWERRGLGIGADAWRLGFERWVIAAGDLVNGATGTPLAIAEATVAASLVAVLVGLIGGIVGALPRTVSRVIPGIDARWALVASLATAGGLVFSRQTQGGGRLLVPLLVLAWVITAATAAAVTHGRGRVVAAMTLLVSVAALMLAVGEVWAEGPGLPVLAGLLVLIFGLGILCLGSLRPARP
ncbi:MAG: hypothetical protein IPK80_33270 [Nannocystis sp.]|nr:hypothetical protein [Nannocystis sp.]